MTFDEFVEKYDGKFLDWDGQYGAQCVDLFRFYTKEVLQFPQNQPVPGAADIWTTFNPEYWEKIPNTPDGIPSKGDVVIWNRRFGAWGHVGIFHYGDVNSFITSFDQNFPEGSPCHLQEHNYKNLYGWLHPKGVGMSPIGDELKELQDKYNKLEEEFKAEQQRVVDCRNDRTDLLTQIDRMRSEFDKERDDYNLRIQTAESKAKAEKELRMEQVRFLSDQLQTTQNWPDIESAVGKLIGVEDLLNKARKTEAEVAEKLRMANVSIQELKAEIERLQKELKQAKGLKDATLRELLVETYERILNRLQSVVRRNQ